MEGSKKRGMRMRGRLAKERKEIDKVNVKGMANSTRTQVLTILNERMSSATRMARELGLDTGEISYEVKVLRELDLIEVEKEVKRRGAVEVFYRATKRAYLDPGEWLSVADSLKGRLRASLFQTIIDDAVVAIADGTYDAREDAHMSWSPLMLDMQGWDEAMAVLHDAMEGVLRIHEESSERLLASDQKGLPCTVSILGYVSALEERKIGPPTDAKDLVASDGHREKKKAETKPKASRKPSTGKRRARKAPAKARRNKRA